MNLKSKFTEKNCDICSAKNELKKCNHFEENQLTAGNSRNAIQHNPYIGYR